MKEKILREIRQELKSHPDKRRINDESKIRYWIRTPIVRKLSLQYFKRIKHLDKKEIFSLAEELLKSGMNEEKTIAFDWIFRLRKQYQKEDFSLFERWIKNYVVDWGDCDDFCTHAIGEFLVQYPSFVDNVKQWSKSAKWPVRRASPVSLIYGLRKGLFLREAFEISNKLFEDKHDLIQKGVGWTLKEASNVFPDEVFDFVLKNKDKMSRITLRYSIEKYATVKRKQALV